MQILLASAKIMNSTTTVQTPKTHLPRFKKEAGQMALELGNLSVEELVKQFHAMKRLHLKISYVIKISSTRKPTYLPSSLTTDKHINALKHRSTVRKTSHMLTNIFG